MQTFQLEVNDNISDKIIWLLSSFKNDVKIKKIDTQNNTKLEDIKISIKTALEEVKESKNNNVKLNDSWDLVDEL